MQIFLDSDKVLHIDGRTYKKEVDLVFVEYSDKQFDIKIASTDDTVLGKILDLTETQVINASGVVYTSVANIYAAIKDVFAPEATGVTGGEYDAVLSDTVDLAHPGWLEATVAGTIKYTTLYGETRTRTVDVGWISLGIVKRVWATGTSATIVVHYE